MTLRRVGDVGAGRRASTTSRPAPHPDFAGRRGAGRRPRLASRRAGSTRRWSRPRRRRASSAYACRLRTTRARSRSSPRSTPRTRPSCEEVRDAIIEIVEKRRRRTASRRRKSSAPSSNCSRTARCSWPTPTGSRSQLSEWAAQGDWRLFFLHRDRIEKVTPADVHAGRRASTWAEQPHGRLLHPDPQARAGECAGRRAPGNPAGDWGEGCAPGGPPAPPQQGHSQPPPPRVSRSTSSAAAWASSGLPRRPDPARRRADRR